jgi:hypothetical protein
VTRTRLISLTGTLALLAAACDGVEPTAPSAAAAARVSLARIGASCTIDVGATLNPLIAVHELEGWLGDAIDAGGSDVTCGQVRSLDAKLETLAKSLDRTPPNFDAACGVSGALANELASLVERGALATPTFPPPFPGGPTDVLAAAQELNARWCAAARGELIGPRS